MKQWLNGPSHGYGFIHLKGWSEEIYVCESTIKKSLSGKSTLRLKDEVAFYVERDRKQPDKWRAREVRVIKN